MAEAGDKGIPLEDYIKFHAPEPLVRAKLDRGQRYLDQTRKSRSTSGRAVGAARERETGRLGRSREQK